MDFKERGLGNRWDWMGKIGVKESLMGVGIEGFIIRDFYGWFGFFMLNVEMRLEVEFYDS